MSSTELTYITIKGFKSIASVEDLLLLPINIVIGPNGSGKSNFIGVFSFLNEVLEGRLQDYVRKAGGGEQLLHFGSKVTDEIYIEIYFKEMKNQYNLHLKPTDDDSLYPAGEVVSFWGDPVKYGKPFEKALFSRENGREAGISDSNVKGIADWIRFRLSLWRLYHLHDTSASSPMRKTAIINDVAFLRPDGANLAAFLYLLKKKHPESYSLIKDSVRMVAPFFDDFILEPEPHNEDSIRLAWKHKNSDKYFNVSALSDGTMRFIALSTLFLQPKKYQPSVILVDEPELGLHPFAITLLASLVKKASKELQVILSTQSSLLLDHFDPEDVLIAKRVGGGTQFTRLETDDLRAWLKDYSLGQLWEKNELGGRPEPE